MTLMISRAKFHQNHTVSDQAYSCPAHQISVIKSQSYSLPQPFPASASILGLEKHPVWILNLLFHSSFFLSFYAIHLLAQSQIN